MRLFLSLCFALILAGQGFIPAACAAICELGSDSEIASNLTQSHQIETASSASPSSCHGENESESTKSESSENCPYCAWQMDASVPALVPSVELAQSHRFLDIYSFAVFPHVNSQLTLQASSLILQKPSQGTKALNFVPHYIRFESYLI